MVTVKEKPLGKVAGYGVCFKIMWTHNCHRSLWLFNSHVLFVALRLENKAVSRTQNLLTSYCVVRWKEPRAGCYRAGVWHMFFSVSSALFLNLSDFLAVELWGFTSQLKKEPSTLLGKRRPTDKTPVPRLFPLPERSVLPHLGVRAALIWNHELRIWSHSSVWNINAIL